MSDEEDGPNRNGADREAPAYQPWALSRNWVYLHLNEQMYLLPIVEGVSLFIKPLEWLPPEGEASARTLYPKANPYLMRGNVAGKVPKLQYDETWNRILVTPHSQAYLDLRQIKEHPDYLPLRKLLQYQAMEVAGWPVWRHDRNTIRCCKAGCEVDTRDHDTCTQLCLGCGPCSGIRYCSQAHMLADLEQHWRECGRAETLMPYFIDPDTRPARFTRRYPLIADVSGLSSFEKHRQRYYSVLSRGQYTVFSALAAPFAVTWPTPALRAQYAPRVERLLNAALLDHSRENVVGSLFYHVRKALRLSGRWGPAAAGAVHDQFRAEFGWNTLGAYDDDPCECVWLGDAADDRQCTAACAQAQRAAGGVFSRGAGLKGLLEGLEARHFLLRVWQRQHPTVKGWRDRLRGVGFPGATVRDLDSQVPLFGKGWNGVGSPHVVGAWEDL